MRGLLFLYFSLGVEYLLKMYSQFCYLHVDVIDISFLTQVNSQVFLEFVTSQLRVN